MCDTLVSLTPDGLMFAKNSDRDPNEAQRIEWHAAAEHPAGARLRCTHKTIGQARATNAVVLSRPWWMWGAEMGANDRGVVIGNQAVFTRRKRSHRSDRDRGDRDRGDRGEGPGLLGMDLLRLALERTSTAHEAVGCIVELLEEHGQQGSCSFEHPGFTYDNSFIVADHNGAIVLETAGRAHGTEIVRAPARSISNGLTIPGFAAVHSDPLRTRAAQATSRRACTEASARGASGVADLFEALRNHGPPRGPGQGLGHNLPVHPHYSPLNGALSAPCAHAGGLLTSTQTTASWVSDLRGDPGHWATGTAAPCTSLFKPVAVDRPVDTGPAPANAFDERTLWWRHEVLHRAVMRNPAALLGRFHTERDALEARWVAEGADPVSAFKEAGEAELRWSEWVTEAVAAGAAPDERPALARRLWRAWNTAAALPKPSEPNPQAN